jgi:hypothetical protein
MNEPALRQPSANCRWPMTGEAWRTLVDELGRLRTDVAVHSGAGAPDPRVIHVPVFKTARRLDVLSAVLDASEKVHETRSSRHRASGDAPRGGRRLGDVRVGLSRGRRSDPRLDLSRFSPRGCGPGMRARRQG